MVISSSRPPLPQKVAELEASDPSNAGFTKLRVDLEEVIRLTKGLVRQAGEYFCCTYLQQQQLQLRATATTAVPAVACLG